jgi:hypothetical protein
MTQTMSCAFCLENGHTIQFCRASLIGDSFKHMIRVSVDSPDFSNTRRLLADYTDTLVCAVSVQLSRALPHESREHHVEKIIEAVNIEINYLRQLTGIHRDEYLRWLNDNDTDDDSVLDLDDSVLNMATIFDRLPDEDEPDRPTALLLCIETQEELREPAECGICLETKTVFDMDTFQCQHPFCHGCVLELLVRNTKISCPFCRIHVKTIEVKDTEHFDEIHEPPLHLYLA